MEAYLFSFVFGEPNGTGMGMTNQDSLSVRNYDEVNLPLVPLGVEKIGFEVMFKRVFTRVREEDTALRSSEDVGVWRGEW